MTGHLLVTWKGVSASGHPELSAWVCDLILESLSQASALGSQAHVSLSLLSVGRARVKKMWIGGVGGCGLRGACFVGISRFRHSREGKQKSSR